MRIACGFDHAGVAAARRRRRGAATPTATSSIDLGTYDDYPDIARGRRAAALARRRRARRARVRLGRGRRRSPRASSPASARRSVHDTYTARQCVEHDDCNVLCLGARVDRPGARRRASCARSPAPSSAARSATCAGLTRSPSIERDGLTPAMSTSRHEPSHERLAAHHPIGRGDRHGLARPDPPLDDGRAASCSGSSTRTALVGVTSNPAIFEKAILGAPTTTSELAELAHDGARASRRSTRTLAIEDVQGAADVLRPGVGAHRRRRRLRLARGRTRRSRATRDAHAREARATVGARRPAERDDQDPRARPRACRRSRGDRRGDQRQRHAAVLVDAWAAIAEAWHRRAWRTAPQRGEPVDVALRRLVLRLARRHRGRQAPEGARQRRSCAASAGRRQRAARLRALAASFGGERFAALRDAGAPLAAAAVGLDRHEGPGVLRRKYVDELGGARDGQHDAAGDAARRPASTASAAADATAAIGAARRPARARAAARLDIDEVTDELLRRRRSARSPKRSTACSPASRPSARRSRASRPRRSSRASPTTHERGDRRARRRGRRTSDVLRRVWVEGRDAVGARGRRRSRRAARLADDRRAACATRSTTLASRGLRARASATARCSAWAARRWRPRCCGRRSARRRARLHVLDSTDPGAVRALEAAIARPDAVPRLLEVGRDARAAVALRLLLGAQRPPWARLRRRHRPRQPT